MLEGDQDPSSGFRAELVPSSRKINAERRAKLEAQVNIFFRLQTILLLKLSEKKQSKIFGFKFVGFSNSIVNSNYF